MLRRLKMHSTSFLVFLVVASFFNSGIAVQTNDSTSLGRFKWPNKYASPQLYVFGGFDTSKTPKHLSSASQFNSSTREWEATTAMSMARITFCGAVVEKKIYLFGGHNGVRETETAEVYDCETGLYSPFRSMPGPRPSCGAAVLGGFIYVAGGWYGSAMSSAIRYNIRTTRRENVRPMHNPRDGLQLVELGGILYAIGGRVKTMEAYNATTDRWTMMATPQYEHSFFGAAAHEGKLYVCSYNGFEVYSPSTDEWETLTPLSPKSARKLVSMNGKLWALGGDSSKSVHSYSTSTKKWTEHADMDVARMYHAAFVVNH